MDTSLVSSGDISIYNGSWYCRKFLHISNLKLLYIFIIKFNFFQLSVYFNAAGGITSYIYVFLKKKKRPVAII